ncbi:MAG: Glyoxalase/bleomycin resistance protein/dioxygenase [Thermoleophilia bacterium]|nr:Glyoxalase/bleomycin resistance protein/dioxygenase [Thermoleophilia bacterium]
MHRVQSAIPEPPGVGDAVVMDTTTDISPAHASPTTHGALPDALRLGHARLVVTDLRRSVPFYEDVIGLHAQERGDDRIVQLATADGAVVLELEERPDAVRAGRHAGLYHVALLYPTRAELAAALHRIARTRTMIDGASDHGTHEAIYLPDPDGNGLELAADRPRDVWPDLSSIDGIRPRALDMQALLGLVEEAQVADRAAAGLEVGHLHLHVGDIAEASSFYVDVVGFEVQTALPVAAFVSAGGYHHHLAYNTWRGEGVPPVPADAVGLAFWTIVLPTSADVDALEARAADAGIAAERIDGAVALRDPWGMQLRARAAD